MPAKQGPTEPSVTLEVAREREAIDRALALASQHELGSDYNLYHLVELNDPVSSLFLWTGDASVWDLLIDHLTASLDAARQSFAGADSGSPQVTLALLVRGTALRSRYRSSGQLDDLDGALRDLDLASKRALMPHLQALPPGNVAYILFWFAQTKMEEYDVTHRLDVLDDAIRAYGDALSFEAPAQGRAAYALALLDRYRELARRAAARRSSPPDPADLDLAIEMLASAVDDTPTDDADLAGRLSNLGNARRQRYEVIGELEDLRAALQLNEAAVAMGESSLPGRTEHLLALARARRLWAVAEPTSSSLPEATAAFRAACDHGERSRAPVTLDAADEWARWAIERESWAEATEAAGYGRRALEGFLRRHAKPTDKEVYLRRATGLLVHEVVALAELGRLDEAIGVVESGRGVVLSDRFPDLQSARRTLDEQGGGDLVEELLENGRRLAADDLSRSDVRRLAARREALLREIELHGGRLERLGPAEVARAAQRPVAYLAAGPSSGLSILLLPDGSTESVWLPDLSQPALSRELEAYVRDVYQEGTSKLFRRRAIDKLCGWLGKSMREVNAAVGAGSEAVAVPLGLLSLLPLHAAWWADGGARRYAIEDVLWTYAPTGRAFARSRRRAATSDARGVLAVYDPQPTAAPELRGARTEVDAIGDRFSDVGVLSGEAATPAAVREQIPRYDVVHFACHGIARLEDPLRSAVILSDDKPFTLAELLDLRLDHVRLTVLSACQTNVVGTRLPDEATSLAVGLNFAGSAGVIGSLWSVPDSASSHLISSFYRYWREEGAEPVQALRRAQLNMLRGEDGARSEWAEPYAWGAFSYVGC